MKTGLQVLLGFYSLIYLYTAARLFFLGGAIGGEAPADPSTDAQIRALSGPFLFICLVLWWIIPQIEKHVGLLRLVCLALVVGSAARFVSYIVMGQSHDDSLAAMMSDFAFPLVLVWQQVVIRRLQRHDPSGQAVPAAAARPLS